MKRNRKRKCVLRGGIGEAWGWVGGCEGGDLEGKGCLRARVGRACSGMCNKMVWATRQRFIISPTSGQELAPARTEGNASREFSWVRSLLPWKGAPQGSRINISPICLYTHLPTLQSGPSRLMTIPTSHLEEVYWRTEVSHHWLEGGCSAVSWQLMRVEYLHSALRSERDMAAAEMREWVPEQISRDSPPPHCGKCYRCYFLDRIHSQSKWATVKTGKQTYAYRATLLALAMWAPE